GYEARDLDENASVLQEQPWLACALRKVAARPLVQPRSGVARVNDQAHLFRVLKAAGADVLSYQIDSLSRNNDYAAAEEGISNSGRGTQGCALNGFPLVNHGVAALRRIAAEIRVPLQTRHSTRDPRLLAELSYAGGISAFEGGPICYNIPYYKDLPLT